MDEVIPFGADPDKSLTDSYGELRPNAKDEELLCHYTRADTALDHLLPSRRLRMNSFRRMRDPLENKELHKMLRFADAAEPDGFSLEEAQKLVGDLRGQMRILSMTTDAAGYEDTEIRAFGRAYARPRMWEQYAEDHRGVCLAFSKNCMIGPFYERSKCFGVASCSPVRYTRGGFAVSPARLIDPKRITELGAETSLTKHVLEHHEDLWFLKLSDWDSEYEYRFLVFAPTVARDEPIDVPFGDCLKAVILGEHFDPARLSQARQLATELGVRLCSLEWGSGRPSVVAVE
jgi:Protein of unknown function (DUF2971)